MKIHYSKKLQIVFSVTIIVLFSLVFFSIQSTQNLIQTARLLAHSTRVISKAEETLKSVVDIEAGVRGYVITNDSTYLDPYFSALHMLPKHTYRLDSLTRKYEKQNVLVQSLSPLLDQRLELAGKIIQARTSSHEEARLLIVEGMGKILSDSIRSTLQLLQSEERSFFRQYNKVTSGYLQRFQYSLVGLSVLSLLVILVLFYQINRQLKVRYDTERKLKKTAEEVTDLYDNAPCGYLSVDASIHLSNMNATLLHWLGYSREEVLGKFKFEDLLTEESRRIFLESFEKDFEKYKEEGYVSNLEFDFVRKDGATLSVIVNSIAKFNKAGDFVSSRTTVFDNAKQKMSEARFKSLLESSPDALVIAKEDGLIHLINNQCSRLFGYSREELIGKPVEQLIPVQFKDRHVHNRTKYASDPNARPMGIGLDLLAVKKSGEEFPVEISLSPLRTNEGLLITAAIRDITLTKSNLLRINQLNQELEAFTYSVSHDLRAPLRSISGYANILMEEYGATFDEESKRVTQIIINNAKRMGQLIDDLLDFSRVGRKDLVKGTIKTPDLVSEILSELQENEKGRTIHVKTLPLNFIKGDSSMIRQVWVNLLSNALKYSSKKEVTEIEVGSIQEDGFTKFYVRDNGTGFDMRYSDKLFGVFQRLHKANEFEGTGVGLALVKRIVQRHGGSVGAEAKVNEGALFYFTLPN